MEKWYGNQKLLQISKACDQAYMVNDEDKMSALVDQCYALGHDQNQSNMVRAKYLYNGYTVLSDLIELRIKRNETSKGAHDHFNSFKIYEADYEKCFYLARTAFDLIDPEMEKVQETEVPEGIEEVAFYFQMVVNYSNLLYQTGRITKALELLKIFHDTAFPMGKGNLGMKIYELSKLHYDSGQQTILLYEAYKRIRETLESPNEYTEREEVTPLLEEYSESIVSLLSSEYLEKTYTLKDFLKAFDNMSVEEQDYRQWIANHRLSLNLLNDVFEDAIVGYDPLHLPGIVGGDDVMYMLGLFNQIKQEYVSARFFAYEGFTKRELHFSDKEVMLINTLDYPVYGLGIEKVKAAYRSVYSIFDKIAYFLNEYFELGIAKGQVGYYRVWSPEKTANDVRKLIDIAERNYPLFGMWWLFKDIRNVHVSNSDKYVDPVMSRISKVRNAMEHTYLKILDFYGGSMLKDDTRADKLAYNISFSDFEKLTITLLRYAREAIILLIFSIKYEERHRKTSHDANALFMPMHTDTYDDEWKQIF